ncbi:MAG: endonuclease/exonuclease/phosphatase family protein [Acidobacteria bacterium]|nr:endonuclease/exonuclease/phosphatase family protein [Acidobacteriota bacterium]
MPAITDTPPEVVKKELNALRESLGQAIPAKQVDRNVLVATWNLRAFGGLTEKWISEPGDSPKRDLQSLRVIAEIISHFDVIALQEVRANLKALRHMVKALGPSWQFLITDVTKGDAGNGERMAFMFDTRKVALSGLACELVVPKEQLDKVGPEALNEQFARIPYAVSFYSGGRTFILVTLHIKYGDTAQDRVPELKAIGQWMADWARDVNAYDHNLIALGDFNIDRINDPLYQAFTAAGLTPAPDLQNKPRTLFANPAAPDLSQFYDQIAWFPKDSGAPALSLTYRTGGNYDFIPTAMPSRHLDKTDLSWHISDHYPLWAEFGVRD